ncbi:FecR family protein [Tellurirhabdus bombi]|uniref:FecR family protein n=1 Tax=Tellurirhabdus bombi TaxID=2907205 RepID=UPI001F1F47C5|nr:FecR domain-containing protein [Tellurirhabdus bombi]
MAEEPENRIDDSLLGKFLAGESDANESERVRHWLTESNEQQEFSRFERIWETAGQLKHKASDTPAPVDTDAAWAKMKGRMKAPAETEKPVGIKLDLQPERKEEPTIEAQIRPLPTRPRSTWTAYWRVAAAVVLLMSLGWFGWRELRQQQTPDLVAQVAVKSKNKTVERLLPDGTKVFLNKDSRIDYPERFAADSREVVLTGEAFFEVKPDAARPFRIKAGQATIQVLGTSFSVRAYTKDVEVAVKTGKVQFAVKKQQIFLTKNEQARYDVAKDTIQRAPRFDPNLFAYKTGQLLFENERLEDIVRTLSTVYRTDIRLSNAKLANCRLTVGFDHNQSIDSVLTITAEPLRLAWRHEGQQYYLYGEECRE